MAKSLRFTGRAYDEFDVVHAARRLPVAVKAVDLHAVYTVCHDQLIDVRLYVAPRAVSCLRCLGLDDYPHSVVTEEYG